MEREVFKPILSEAQSSTRTKVSGFVRQPNSQGALVWVWGNSRFKRGCNRQKRQYDEVQGFGLLRLERRDCYSPSSTKKRCCGLFIGIEILEDLGEEGSRSLLPERHCVRCHQLGQCAKRRRGR